MNKKRRIAAKPTDQAAANWVKAGGVDPEIPKNSDAQTSKQANAQTPALPKSKNPDYTRTTIYLPKALHKQLKVASAQDEIEMSDIAQQAIESWMSNRADV